MKAKQYFERALKIRERALGNQHPDTAQSYWWLGVLAQEGGDLVEAQELYSRAFSIYQHVLGEGHPTTQSVKQFLQTK